MIASLHVGVVWFLFELDNRLPALVWTYMHIFFIGDSTATAKLRHL